ncbi:MAG: enolase C-terminal domain-like protein [Candidatus Pacearchaeota archaeon]
MKIKKVIAKQIKDSRREFTIKVIVKTGFFTRFETSSPAGKSTGSYEARSYAKSLDGDCEFINSIDPEGINEIINRHENPIGNTEAFSILKDIEKLVKNNIGANTLFALEASLLKMFAHENNKQLYEFLHVSPKSDRDKKFNLPHLVGNAIGGGLHSKGVKGIKPDFQEFLFVGDSDTIKECVKTNKEAYLLAGGLLNAKNKNDEGAWETDKTNEEVLDIMNQVQEKFKEQGKDIFIGVDAATSSFYKEDKYVYKNNPKELNKSQQVEYIKELINKYSIYYLEDPLEENDFSGFKSLTGRNCFIVGDDLTTTNPERLEKAVKNKSINAIIVKPNQIGSLLKVKEVIDLAKKNKIVTIISHRSGETMDNTIADLAVAWGCNFIKTGIYGRVREAKLKRLIEIEKQVNKEQTNNI